MFPFLFMTLWRMLKGIRNDPETAPRHRARNVTDVNHNQRNATTPTNEPRQLQTEQPRSGRRRQNNGNAMSARKRKAYAIMVISMMGLFIPILLLAVRSLLFSIYDRTHHHIVWQTYRPDHNQIQNERLTSMQKYDFPHNKSGVDKRFRLSLREFNDVYDGKWPVIITDAIARWRAFKWSDEFLSKNYGKEKLFMKIVKNGVESADVVSLSYFMRHLSDGAPNDWKYIEDEHFLALRPELKSDVGETVYTLDDMFQSFPESIRPWDSMLLWGTAHSRSPLHMDPYNWTGTNAVLRGHKKWKLYPPGQDDVMYLREHQRCHFPLDCVKYNSLVDAFDPYRLTRFPRFDAARFVDVDQYPGEILFIPSGWYHQAYNVEPTLAVSGQLMNARNYMIILEEILRANPIPVHNLPNTFYTLSPEYQAAEIRRKLNETQKMKFHEMSRLIKNEPLNVRMILSKIPKEVHDRGIKITQDARRPQL